MTPFSAEERADQVLGRMEIAPGKGKEREDNWLLILAQALREAEAQGWQAAVEKIVKVLEDHYWDGSKHGEYLIAFIRSLKPEGL